MGAAEGGNVRGVDLVAVDGVIADLQLFVGEPQRQEDADHLEDDERRDRGVADHPARRLGLPAQQRPVSVDRAAHPGEVGGAAARADVDDHVRIEQDPD